MPKYGGVHYPNTVKGITKGYFMHVKDNNAKNKFGSNKHVPNGRDTFGDPIKKNATGFDKRDCLRGDSKSTTNY